MCLCVYIRMCSTLDTIERIVHVSHVNRIFYEILKAVSLSVSLSCSYQCLGDTGMNKKRFTCGCVMLLACELSTVRGYHQRALVGERKKERKKERKEKKREIPSENQTSSN